MKGSGVTIGKLQMFFVMMMIMMMMIQVNEHKTSAKTGTTGIDVRVTSADDDVMPISGRACAVACGSSMRSGMPATCSPTITLLQKRRGR